MRTRTGVCPVCDQTFEYEVRSGTRPVYCSPQHQSAANVQRQRAKKLAMTERHCKRCDTTKPTAEFYSVNTTYCRPCMAEYARNQYRRNSAEFGSDYVRTLNLRRYGLTLETFAAMIEAQGGKCAVCGRDEPGGQGEWHVDHDHSCCSTRKISCGKCIRGLLCTRCNIGIGNFADNPETIRAAADYLDAHAARRAAHPAAPAV